MFKSKPRRFSLSKEEIRRLKKDISYILMSKFSYGVIEKSKISVAVNLLADKMKNYKDERNSEIDELVSKIEYAQRKLKEFIRNYFFNKNCSSVSSGKELESLKYI